MKIYSYPFKSPFGTFRITATPKGLYSLEEVKERKRKRSETLKDRIPPRIDSLLRLAAREILFFLEGKRVYFQSLPIDWTGYGTFEKKVLRELRKIPWGSTQTYQSLARRACRPQAARAVGRVLHHNRLPFVLPCHRIVLKGGGLGGFSRGLRVKRRLLKLESRRVDKKDAKDQEICQI